MDLDMNRKNVLEYLKEFKKSIPTQKSLLSRKVNVDASKISDNKDKINLFYEKGFLVSPMLIDSKSIEILKENIELIKQFPQQLKPDVVLENEILTQTSNSKRTRRVLIPSVVEKNAELMDKYDKMISYYLLMGGDKPIERFSKIEMSMKQSGVKPDVGVSIMKYGDEITSKLEEIANSGKKSSKEWEYFKEQVLHSFTVAEKIGNRNVNKEEHKNWEERLVRLGLIERKIDKETEQKENFKETIKLDLKNKSDDDKDESKQTVSLESAIQKNAEQMYINTGIVPIGYKKDENGKITRIQPDITKDERANRLSATKNSVKKEEDKKQRQQLSR